MTSKWYTVGVMVCLGSVLVLAADAQRGASGRSTKAHIKTLRPADGNEVELEEITYATDDAGHRRLVTGGSLKNHELESLFTIVNPKTNEYMSLRLGGNYAADARRIRNAYQRLGTDMDEKKIADGLRKDDAKAIPRIINGRAKAKTNSRQVPRQAGGSSPRSIPVVFKPGLTQRPEIPRLSSPEGCKNGPALLTRRQPGPTVKPVQIWVDSCDGYAYSDIQTWEPAAYLNYFGIPVEWLNETYTDATWYRYGDYVWIQDDRSSDMCWANPQTFLLTHWFTVACVPSGSAGDYGFDQALTGEYFNSDFFQRLGIDAGLYGSLDPVPITVTSTASVQYVGFPNWGADYYEDASGGVISYIEGWFGTVLLTEHAYGFADEPYCDEVCDPDEIYLDECYISGSTAYWDYDNCYCADSSSPIIIDLDGDGLSLTNPPNGVSFDLLGDGRQVRTAWTATGARDAFLALDRNGNGTIDSAAELFGDVTQQPPPATKKGKKSHENGFAALAAYDQREYGGNNDHQITEDDAVFSQLRLWLDTNHDGISEPNELKSLDEMGVRSISLRYTASKQKDQFGNVYRYRSNAIMDRHLSTNARVSKNVVDVYFTYEK